MAVTEINAKSLLRKHKRIDSWFVSQYGMNIYRGCSHNCVYCDGRSEIYGVNGIFGRDIEVKVNAPELLRKELSPEGKRKPLKKSFILLGGGVNDCYEPLEKKYEITRQLLKIIHEFNFPVHILTKSLLLERDLDIIREINNSSKAIVSFSFSSADSKISKIFEPGCPAPQKRFDLMKKIKSYGIPCGAYLMPVIPFVTDLPFVMGQTFHTAKQSNADFIIMGSLTLKEGRQKDCFMNILNQHYPELVVNYDQIYYASQFGETSEAYNRFLTNSFDLHNKMYGFPKRIPASLFKDVLHENDLVSVIFDQMDFLLKSKGLVSQFGFAAYSISKLDIPLSKLRSNLRKIKGVGPVTDRIIKEILDTGTSKKYEQLLV